MKAEDPRNGARAFDGVNQPPLLVLNRVPDAYSAIVVAVVVDVCSAR